jgi:hypothetical protein
MVVTFRQVGFYNFMEMRKWGLYTSRLRRVSTVLKEEIAGHVRPELFSGPLRRNPKKNVRAQKN